MRAFLKNSPWSRWGIVLGALAATITLWACSVPVFRYGLEHWEPDEYRAVVFHRGALTPEQQAQVRDLGPDGAAGRTGANLKLHTVDLDANPTPEEAAFWKGLGANKMPWLVVRPPAQVQLPANLWSGPLTGDAVKTVTDSPMRREIVKQLLHGQSAVWVLLEIGDRAKDDAAAKLVSERLAYLKSVMKLPKLDQQDIVNGLVSVGEKDLKLDFTFLRLARDNAAEAAFVKMLLGTEADLADAAEPIVFPVFGRGRVLYALIGKGINHETIDEAAAFLTGSCSCQTKELNPGVDLLVAAKWAERLAAAATVTPAAATAANESAPVTVNISGGGPATAPAGAPPHRPWAGVLAGFVAALLAAAGVYLWKRR